MSNPPIIIVPGWQNSCENHWQSLWEKKFSATRVQQKNWDKPMRSDWVKSVESLVRDCDQPPIIVAHSMGVLTTVLLSSETDCQVAAAFLVSPVDLTQTSTSQVLINFLPIPEVRLRFPSVLVGSESDPYCTIIRAQAFAESWGSEFFNAGDVGHINVDSGFGEWLAGDALFREFTSGRSCKESYV